MPRLSEATSRSRREQIAAAAMRCVARQGFANTSMADIINESGLSNGAIYSHFATKSELITFTASAMLESRTRRLAEDIAAGRTESAPGRVFAWMVDELVERERAKALIQVWAEIPRDATLGAVARENVGRLRALLASALMPWARERAERSGEVAEEIVRPVTDTLLAALQGYIVRIAIDSEADPAALAESIAATLDPS